MKLDRDDEEHNYDPFYNPINGGISVSKVNLILNLFINQSQKNVNIQLQAQEKIMSKNTA